MSGKTMRDLTVRQSFPVASTCSAGILLVYWIYAKTWAGQIGGTFEHNDSAHALYILVHFLPSTDQIQCFMENLNKWHWICLTLSRFECCLYESNIWIVWPQISSWDNCEGILKKTNFVFKVTLSLVLNHGCPENHNLSKETSLWNCWLHLLILPTGFFVKLWIHQVQVWENSCGNSVSTWNCFPSEPQVMFFSLIPQHASRWKRCKSSNMWELCKMSAKIVSVRGTWFKYALYFCIFN